MADISEKKLKKEIAKILKNDKKLAPKKVRQKLEDILDTDLSEKKKLIEKLVTEYSIKNDDEEKDDDEDDDDEDNGKKKSGKRSASAAKSSSKKARKASSEDEAEDGSDGSESEDDKKKKKNSDSESDDEGKKESASEEKSEETIKEEFREEIAKILKNANLAKTSSKKVRQTLEKKLGVDLTEKKKLIDELVMDYVTNKDDGDEEDEEEDEKPAKKKKKGSDDNDSDWGKGKAKKSPKVKKAGRGKGGGYTRAYKLSPALAELMGAEEMPRHEVVRRVWDIIKTKQLYDPNNRQFAICDHALYKVFGTTRFRTFGMMKYLKSHFLDD